MFHLLKLLFGAVNSCEAFFFKIFKLPCHFFIVRRFLFKLKEVEFFPFKTLKLILREQDSRPTRFGLYERFYLTLSFIILFHFFVSFLRNFTACSWCGFVICDFCAWNVWVKLPDVISGNASGKRGKWKIECFVQSHVQIKFSCWSL